MILFPAIDLKDGQCVRLYKGDMDKSTVYNDNPAAQAKEFSKAGCSWLHVVDLNGAMDGKPVNAEAVQSILEASDMPVQLGGGMRSMNHIEFWLSEGVSRVILGTAAINNPDLVREACDEFPGQIAVGLDARGGMVATEGWTETSDTTAVEIARYFEDTGVAAIIYTDIDRDGTKEGPNIAETLSLAQKLSTPVIASGGVGSLDDLRALKEIEDEDVIGVIAGRALYDNQFTVAQALEILSND